MDPYADTTGKCHACALSDAKDDSEWMPDAKSRTSSSLAARAIMEMDRLPVRQRRWQTAVFGGTKRSLAKFRPPFLNWQRRSVNRKVQGFESLSRSQTGVLIRLMPDKSVPTDACQGLG